MKVNYDVFNLGSGSGYSVDDVVKTYQECLGEPINWVYTARREGDLAQIVANPGKVNK